MGLISVHLSALPRTVWAAWPPRALRLPGLSKSAWEPREAGRRVPAAQGQLGVRLQPFQCDCALASRQSRTGWSPLDPQATGATEKSAQSGKKKIVYLCSTYYLIKKRLPHTCSHNPHNSPERGILSVRSRLDEMPRLRHGKFPRWCSQ